MSTTHTPGPWEARSRSMTDGSLVVMSKDWNAESGHEEICCVRPKPDREYGEQDERDKANATLIAGAPELLQALEHLTKEMRDSPRFSKLNVRKDFSLMNAHAYACNVIWKVRNEAETRTDTEEQSHASDCASRLHTAAECTCPEPKAE